MSPRGGIIRSERAVDQTIDIPDGATVAFDVAVAEPEVVPVPPAAPDVRPPGLEHAGATPFRAQAADLVAMFQIAEAGDPAWHRNRALTLQRQAHHEPVAAVASLWCRLAERHLATAELLEQPALEPPARRFRRKR
jgi:hypothetical protein